MIDSQSALNLLSNATFLRFQLGDDQSSYPKELNDTLKMILTIVKDYLMCIVFRWLQQWLYINQWSCCRTVLLSIFFSTHLCPVEMVLLHLLLVTAAFFTKSASIASNFIEFTFREYLLVKHPTLLLCPDDVFALIGSRFFNLMEGSCSACYRSIVSSHWWHFPWLLIPHEVTPGFSLMPISPYVVSMLLIAL